MATLDGVNGELVRRFLALQGAAAQAGFRIGVSSGRRDQARQIQLRKDNGCPDVWSAPASQCRIPTAIPGTSNHEFGFAIDISGSADAKGWVATNAARFGLGLPVEGEDWHLEMLEDARSRGFQQGTPGAIGFNLQWQDEAQDPMAVVDARMTAIRDMITGAQRDALAEIENPAAGADMLANPAAGAPEIASPAAPEVGTTPLATDTTTIPSPMAQQTTVVGGAAPGGGQWSGGDIPPPGFVPPGEGVERWSDVARAALRYTGQNESWLPLLLQRMKQESGGNPTIVNNWDINAQRGDPSIGLMQNIGSAFPERARELAGRGIRDGFANIVASIRYTLNRYGTLAAWGRPGGY